MQVHANQREERDITNSDVTNGLDLALMLHRETVDYLASHRTNQRPPDGEVLDTILLKQLIDLAQLLVTYTCHPQR